MGTKNSFKPAFYNRYIDDTFLLFKDSSHIDLFLQYLNSKHPSINFTKETECNNVLNFLDVSISKEDNVFKTSVYRKPTFTGMGTSFFSFCQKTDQ